MQIAAVAGVLGLSFWVILTNLAALKELWRKKNRQKGFVRWLGIAIVPYLFGAGYLFIHADTPNKQPISHVALVQTGLLPSQKIPLEGRLKDFVSPWKQWERIFTFLKDYEDKKPSLIVLPEYSIPFPSSAAVYDLREAAGLLENSFGLKVLEALPPFHPPLSENCASTVKEGPAFLSPTRFSANSSPITFRPK